MVENKQQLFLYDRWYYLIDENNNKLIYSTKPNDKSNSNILEIDDTNNEMKIIFFSNNKELGKINVINTDSDDIMIHYEQLECEKLNINNEVYTNLLLEVYLDKRNKLTNNSIKVLFSKKTKHNKNGCKKTSFPLDRRINISDIKIKSEEVDYIVELIQYIPHFAYKIKNLITAQQEHKEEIKQEKIVELHIPQDIYVYDRIYTLIKSEDNRHLYQNKDQGIANLEVNLDLSNCLLLDATIQTKNEIKSEDYNHIIKLSCTDNKVVATYNNCKKLSISLNGDKLKDVIMKAKIVCDSNDKIKESALEIQNNKHTYRLVQHPIFKNQYVDSDGKNYNVSNGEFASFQSISRSTYRIFKHIEKSFFKEKELIKKVL